MGDSTTNAENTSSEGPVEKILYPHPNSRSYPDTGNLSRYTIQLGGQARWNVHESPTMDHMCGKCFAQH